MFKTKVTSFVQDFEVFTLYIFFLFKIIYDSIEISPKIVFTKNFQIVLINKSFVWDT